ncbi:alpha-L-rhamnosidase [Microlunatus elymi]|uniref:alpha-L-rhamnosidase n=1 Tax=Microlunatus elymi TaxID=2596828 RepID=UPI00143D239C|nr:alpha-L-rhamnosidase [Microlunatus elymi]
MTAQPGDDAATRTTLPSGDQTFGQVGRWISAPPPSDADQYRTPVLFTHVTITEPIRAAVLSVCGLGLQDVRIDDLPINDHRLDPPFTDFDRRVLYVSTDVTALLTPGTHRISITLGRGFFAVPTENVWRWHQAPWSGPLRAIAELRIDQADGRTKIIGTDPSWQTTLGRTTYDCYYAGESYDATLELPAAASAVPADAPKGELQPVDHEPIRVTWQGRPSWQRVGDAWVADFGRTIAGWVGLRSDQQRGAEVKIIYAEKLEDDGSCAPDSVHVSGDRFQTDSYVGDGAADQYWEPRFSYKGFRYVQLDGLSHPPREDTLTAYAAHNDIARIAEFACSEELFQTFVGAMARTIENNLHHIPTDTPVYEKNGWTGDAQVGTVSMLSLFDLRRVMIKWLDDLADAQRPDGAIPVIVPSGGWGFAELAPAPEWTTVYPHLLRELFRRTGDLDLVRRHWVTLIRYLDWELGKLVDGCAVSALGDYLQPGTHGLGPDDSGVTASSFLIRALRDSAELALLIGEQPDHRRLLQAAQQVTDAMNAKFLDHERGQYVVGPVYSQTSNAVPLVFGLVPGAYAPAVVEHLVADIAERDDHLNVGCIGANTVLKALTDHGHGDLALRVARQTSYPSWGYWFANGADTMWEMWETTARSRDHYFHGTVVQWLFEEVAGLRCGDHGWQTMIVQPHPIGDLQHVAYGIETIRGRAAVSWQRDQSGRFTLTVDVPAGCTALVRIPGASATVVSGTASPSLDHDFEVTGGRTVFTSQL